SRRVGTPTALPAASTAGGPIIAPEPSKQRGCQPPATAGYWNQEAKEDSRVATDGQMFGQPSGTGGPPRPTSGVEEVHILWTSEGMSCDGDSVSVTAAMQPSLEDVVLGLIPGLPRVHLHNKVLDASLGGDDFMRAFHQAANGQLDAPYVFVVEVSIPN